MELHPNSPVSTRPQDVPSLVSHAALSQSAQAAITEHHSLGGLNNRHIFLTVLEVEKSKIKGLINLIPDESCLFGLQTFSLYLHMGEREREITLWYLLL